MAQRRCRNCGSLLESSPICPACSTVNEVRGIVTLSGGLSILLGYLCGLGFGAAAVYLANAAQDQIPGGWAYFAGVFILVPIGMGVVAALFWANLGLGTGGKLGHACGMGLISQCLAGKFLTEGT